jgi:hypothetical protein
MKFNIISGLDRVEVIRELDYFAVGRNIIDTKFSTQVVEEGFHTQRIYYSVLITYEE